MEEPLRPAQHPVTLLMAVLVGLVALIGLVSIAWGLFLGFAWVGWSLVVVTAGLVLVTGAGWWALTRVATHSRSAD